MPGCYLRELPVSTSGTAIVQMVPQGRGLYSATDPTTGLESLFVLGTSETAQLIEKPSSRSDWKPVLAGDASVIAWIDDNRIPGVTGTNWSIRVRDLSDMSERTINLQGDAPNSFELIAFDRGAGRFVARRDGTEFVSVDNAGLVMPELHAPVGRSQPNGAISGLRAVG